MIKRGANGLNGQIVGTRGLARRHGLALSGGRENEILNYGQGKCEGMFWRARDVLRIDLDAIGSARGIVRNIDGSCQIGRTSAGHRDGIRR